ncbi:MAG: SDR family oxidoreductase [Sedimentisphaerales bacterium]|nr:SDR family oxidoreductase [Sedimentisphaerales bacterium]
MCVLLVAMTSRRFDLTGRTALVTGAGRGIGLALARGLAEHGAGVALVARTAGELEAGKARIEAETGVRAWAFPYDLAELDGIEELFGSVLDAAGGVDILVNCAGTTVREPTEEVSLETFNRVMEVNLTAALLLSQAFCRHRKQVHKPGRIINIGSLACHAARPTIAAYACSKMGLLGLTKTLAVEWARYDINVNAIGPGYIATELTAPLQADAKFDKWVLSKTPLGRWGRPEDLVGAAVLLASQAGDFITGQIFYVDGGWTALV